MMGLFKRRASTVDDEGGLQALEELRQWFDRFAAELEFSSGPIEYASETILTICKRPIGEAEIRLIENCARNFLLGAKGMRATSELARNKAEILTTAISKARGLE